MLCSIYIWTVKPLLENEKSTSGFSAAAAAAAAAFVRICGMCSVASACVLCVEGGARKRRDDDDATAADDGDVDGRDCLYPGNEQFEIWCEIHKQKRTHTHTKKHNPKTGAPDNVLVHCRQNLTA